MRESTNSALDYFKMILRPIWRSTIVMWIRNLLQKKSLEQIHEYWKCPNDGANDPKNYLAKDRKKRSDFLVNLVKNHTEHNPKILEIGCNVGRNLNQLFQTGCKHLTAIEISSDALQMLKESYPELSEHVTIYNKSVEEAIKEMPDSAFDVVFTMAVLEHIHPDSEWIFQEMVRISKHLIITIEDENTVNWRTFKRNYKIVFEKLGLKQIYESNVIPGLGEEFFARVFSKD